MWLPQCNNGCGLIRGAVCAFAAFVVVPFAALAAISDVVDRSALRVCADPHNLPFSNQAGDGFENKIAQLLAKELGVSVRYTWYPQSMGFIRQTLRARRCDIVIGISIKNELVQNTNPYYRSTYVMAYRADSGVTATSLDDPVLKTLRIGVVAGTPPASLIAKHGLLDRVHPYHLMVDTRYQSPGKQMIEDLAEGEIDIALLWGPIAGYYAKQQKQPITIVLLKGEPGTPKMQYWISMGIRYNEPDWKHQLNELIKRLQPEIKAILRDYGVPLLNVRGEPVEQ